MNKDFKQFIIGASILSVIFVILLNLMLASIYLWEWIAK